MNRPSGAASWRTYPCGERARLLLLCPATGCHATRSSASHRTALVRAFTPNSRCKFCPTEQGTAIDYAIPYSLTDAIRAISDSTLVGMARDSSLECSAKHSLVAGGRSPSCYPHFAFLIAQLALRVVMVKKMEMGRGGMMHDAPARTP